MEITKCVGVGLHTSSLGVVQTRVNVSYILHICLPVRHLFQLLAYFMFLTLYVCVTGKRGNVEITHSPQAGIETGASRSKIQHSTE